ncbi:hypothetical protein Tco_0128100 [Tanacetum coccineum]
MVLEEKTAELDEGQAGSDPGITPESRPPPEQDLMEEDQARSDPRLSHVALAGLNPEPMHDDFVAIVYPSVHENLKHATEEQVHMEIPLSLSGTLLSMKNLDNFNFGDQFVNDNPTKEDSGKTNMETKFESIVIVPIHQASILVPPLSTPSSIFHLQNLIFTLELRDLPHKIDQTVNEVVKEAVHVALQAPLRDRFRDLPEADMEEIIHQRMFKNGTYKSLPEHVALYEAIEASMERAIRDEFLAEKDKSRKRRRNDQETPQPPPPKSDQSKKTRHDFDIRTPATWLRPLPEEDKPKTPEPDWPVPPNDLPEPKNNWANALATTYKEPKENKLLWKTGDMGSFIKWYCKLIGKKKLTKVDLEVPNFMTVKQFHTNSIFLQFQMEECHWLLTNKIDLVNPEGDRIVPDISKPLPLGGPPGQLGIESYQIKLNLTKPRWDASDFLFKEDYSIVSEPRAIIYRDRNDEKKMLTKENEG